jgi:hypothetical protein
VAGERPLLRFEDPAGNALGAMRFVGDEDANGTT